MITPAPVSSDAASSAAALSETGAPATPSRDRAILSVTGNDRLTFLQGLVSNDAGRLADGSGSGLVYAALLSPQGKYLADFLLVPQGDAILIDIAAPLADALARRLAMYRLRADVQIAPLPLSVGRGLGTPPQGAFADPRHPAMGWRHYGGTDSQPGIDWDAIRVAHCIPESGIELIPDETYPLEAGFERLHGIDFRKGCYVGQEVTARMKHKTDLRKGLVRVRVDAAGDAPPHGTPVLTEDGRTAGALYTQAGGEGLAHLRFDRTLGPMTAGAARVSLADPAV